MADDKPQEIPSPGGDWEDIIYEQVEGQKYAIWNKHTRTDGELPEKFKDRTPLSECNWKLAEQPESYGDKNQLWVEVKTFIQAHVFIPDERLYDVLTAWVLASWVPERWNVIPYLLIKGPMSSGKTRLLETLEAISYRGIFSANISSAALFRLSDLYRPTLFLDETEIYSKEEYSDVTHLLNAGYRRGQKALRIEHDREGQPYVRGYDVFGFKALSGTKELVNTLQSRSIIIDMVKNINRVNFRVNEKRAVKLRNRLLQYRFNELSSPHAIIGDEIDEIDEIEKVYTPLKDIADLGDGRLLELFCPLILVANSGTENIVSYAKQLNENRIGEEQTGIECQCLEALIKCVDQAEYGKILVKTIKNKVNEGLTEKEQFTTHFITKTLSTLGFKRTHLKQGVGIIIDETMLSYRVRQYKLGDTTLLAESSKSSKSSLMEFNQDEKIMVQEQSTCFLCLKPIPEDHVDVTVLDGKYVHIPCMLKLNEGSFNPNLSCAKPLRKPNE